MAASVGTGTQKGRNIDLNIVPFIDLMSCLTAFLLVTAVWVNTAQLNIQPKGRARDAPPCESDPRCEDPKLSILVEPDAITVGVSRVNDFQKIPRLPSGAPDWAMLETTLKVHKGSTFFVDKTDIEIAANSTTGSPVDYQTLIAAMDIAVKSGFIDVGLTDPNGLSARPTL
jgi:biopolymer transport protein TolR